MQVQAISHEEQMLRTRVREAGTYGVEACVVPVPLLAMLLAELDRLRGQAEPPPKYDHIKGDWGALPAEPCRFCHRPGGVHFMPDEGPEGLAGEQICRCDLCGNTWNATGGKA